MALATTARPGRLDALDALIDAEEAALGPAPAARTSCTRTAAAHLPGGVASSWQDAPPCPIFVDRGRGSRVWDVDGNEYVDLHAGFGAMIAGHAHPAIVAAVRDRVAAGTHFAQPVPDIIPVAEELARRFGLPAVALRQLRHRGDAGRRPPDARRHRPAAADQGRGQLPRPPRRACRCRCTRTTADAGPADRPRAVPEHGAVVARRWPRSPTSCRSAASTPCAGSCSTTPARSPG